MANAKDIVCPVEACKAAVDCQCKLVDMQKHPMVGRYHLDRVRAVGKQTRDENIATKKEQDAKKLLRTSNRVMRFI